RTRSRMWRKACLEPFCYARDRLRRKGTTSAKKKSELLLENLSQLCGELAFLAWLILLCAVNCVLAASPMIAAEADWQREWGRTLEAAKKEGQVTVYISGYEAVLPDFEKEFPDIKVVAVAMRGNQLGQRLLAERRAEKHIADVVSSGANPNYQQFYQAKALDPIKPALILPEVTDQTKW